MRVLRCSFEIIGIAVTFAVTVGYRIRETIQRIRSRPQVFSTLFCGWFIVGVATEVAVEQISFLALW